MKGFFKNKRVVKTLTDGVITIKLVHKSDYHRDPVWLPTLVYDIVHNENKKIIGRCDLRIGMNAYMYYMGNIGYVIYYPYRGHRYATRATKLLFEIAKDYMDECIITCNPDNPASIKTCEYAGCQLVEKVLVPDDHELILQDEYIKLIYKKTLNRKEAI